jgi:hypothetical protein
VDDPLPPAVSEPPPPGSHPTAIPVATPPALYHDRSTGLVVFGIIQIVLGGLAALFIPLVLLGAVFSRRMGGGMPPGNTVLSVASYALAAIGLITLGVGSIRACRWARALTLILSWIWLVSGSLGTIALTVLLPSAFMAAFTAAAANNPEAPSLPRGLIAVILTVVIVVCAVFMVVLPIAFVVFYRRKDVAETVKHRDPRERWTDRCPLPVLALSLLFIGSGVYYLLMSVTTPIFPLFGRYLTGLPAGICLMLLAMLDGFLAYSLFRLQLTGWWIAVVAVALRWTSAIVTFARGDLLAVYRKMGLPQQQLQLMSANPMLRSTVFEYWTAAFGLMFLGYMIWVKRYLAAAGEPVAAGSGPSYPASMD